MEPIATALEVGVRKMHRMVEFWADLFQAQTTVSHRLSFILDLCQVIVKSETPP